VIGEFSLETLQVLMPLVAGGLIIAATLLTALFRGMSAGIIVSLLIGSAMLIAPIFLASSQSTGVGLAQSTAETAESAARVARTNRTLLTDLERAISAAAVAMEAALQRGDPGDVPEAVEALAKAREELAIYSDTLAKGAELDRTLETDLEALQIEMRRANFLRRRAAVVTR
jgi:predicted ATP-grasp superfamily ATP-dependent carboligase